MTEKMNLALDLSFSHMEGRWRLPGSWVGRDFPDFAMYRELAQIAERGRFDMIFFGDGTGIPSTWGGSIDAAVKWGVGWPRQDMGPFIAALSQWTQHVGFGITYASTFMHPFYTARLLNSLDHITSGRIAFNIVTSSRRADAQNYGFDELMEHDRRYERMEEFVSVCKALWKSVAPDALIRDRKTGVFADPSKVKAIDHVGEFFKVKGPLNSVPSPQGRPVLIQAGGSPRGIAASANFADVVFGGARNVKAMAAHRVALDAALVEAGRDPATVGILWDIQLVVGETEQEAKAHKASLMGLLPPEATGVFMSHNTGYDFSNLPPKFALRELADKIAAANASPVGIVHQLMVERGENYEMTAEEFFEESWQTATGYNHTHAGTAEQVADELEEMFEASGSRGGFMVAHPQVTPRDLVDVVGLLVPELRDRGRLPEQYEGSTLRENLGLAPFA
jgi:FMN-dependent oxidoreductase (nitrilotriacetate monooxygenase family)